MYVRMFLNLLMYVPVYVCDTYLYTHSNFEIMYVCVANKFALKYI